MLFTPASSPIGASGKPLLDGPVLITGAGAGIGRAFAEALASRKHALVLVDRDAEALESTARSLRDSHQIEVHTVVVDLSDPTGARLIFDFCKSRGIDVGVLLNNAAVGMHSLFDEQPPERIDEMIRVNVSSLVALSRLFIADMKQRNSGAIINVSSAGVFEVCPRWSVYAATKAFVQHFTESLQVELEGTGVRAILVCPGMTSTGFFEKAGHDVPSDEELQSPQQVVAETLEALDRGQTFVVTGRANKLRVHTHRATLRKLLSSVKRGLRRVAMMS